MVKTCAEIDKEIEELRRKLQQNKTIELSIKGISERKKCKSSSANVMCSNCDCWKSAKEYCS